MSEPSDWEKYAAEEYEILVAEEGSNDQEEMYLHLMCGRHNISYHNPKSFIITSSSCKINSFSLIQTVLHFNFFWGPGVNLFTEY